MMGSFLANVGKKTIRVAGEARQLGALVARTLYWSFVAPFTGRGIKWRSVLKHMVDVGFNSLPIVCFICALIGAILAFQSAYQLKNFGAIKYVPPLVGVGMTRELGPLIAAIIMAGRSGSAFTAEIGAMVVNEEVDALETMGLNPIKFLVVPKFLAMAFMQPCLTIIADLVGIFGGFMVSVFGLKMNPHLYFVYLIEHLLMKDITAGLIKSVVFGAIIAIVGCHFGFSVSGGADSVGKATTASVVTSIFMVIAANFVFAVIFYLLF
jgi:phospholipid/cholesterol/gamma-HCH transport system permease protein